MFTKQLQLIRRFALTFHTKEFYLFLFISLFIRLANYYQATFFIWDNGRDYFAVQRIVAGDITLIGPTTGLQGFFLGPLWYYLGVPGMVLGQGDPTWFLLSYVLIGLSCLPLFWYLSRLLFKNDTVFLISAYSLSLLPGSILGSTRVWNPLISLPLLSLMIIGLLQIRNSRWYVALSFFSLGLLLQSEFAYGVFYLPVLFLLLPRLRGRFNWQDFLIGGISIAITLLPQLLFELRNDFIMTTSLLRALTAEGTHIPWSNFAVTRIIGLYLATRQAIVGHLNATHVLFIPIFIGVLISSIMMIKNSLSHLKNMSTKLEPSVLISICFLVPYAMFLIWRGNNDYFFDYYLTPHFIFFVPAVIFAWQTFIAKKIHTSVTIFLLGVISCFAFIFMYDVQLMPNNQAGLAVMRDSVTLLRDWIKEDGQNPGVVRVYTPNAETEHYDAIIHHDFKQAGLPIPTTVRSADDAYWYILIEPERILQKRWDAWRVKEEMNGVMLRQQTIGVLTMQTWVRSDVYQAKYAVQATQAAELDE